jgi:hypothetical protein
MKSTSRGSPFHFDQERILYEFLTTDLELCATFIRVAETQILLENQAHAKAAIGKATRAIEAVQGYLRKLGNPELRGEMETKLTALRKRRDYVKHKLEATKPQ